MDFRLEWKRQPGYKEAFALEREWLPLTGLWSRDLANGLISWLAAFLGLCSLAPIPNHRNSLQEVWLWSGHE